MASQSVIFIPRSEEATARNAIVSRASVVSHDLLTAGGNHWCIYLLLTENNKPNKSVRIDVTPSGDPSNRANIVVSLLKYRHSHETTHVAYLSTAPGLTAGAFVDLIVDRGRDRFKFNSEGRGCRSWTTDQINLFLEANLITSAEEAEQAKEDILYEWKDWAKTGKKYDLSEGAYY